MEDVLGLLETVAAVVITVAVLPEGDEDMLVTFGTNVGRKLALLRFGTLPRAGSA